jgi:aerobic-type carbon monoxide dehydrogenase small subunit (CoxS/CutS family)
VRVGIRRFWPFPRHLDRSGRGDPYDTQNQWRKARCGAGSAGVAAGSPARSAAAVRDQEGCDHGQCGACTVHVDDRPMVSCLTLAMPVDGREVRTIASVAGEDGTLHRLQQAFIDNDAPQCGYCTPGQIMSGLACIKETCSSVSKPAATAAATELGQCTCAAVRSPSRCASDTIRRSWSRSTNSRRTPDIIGGTYVKPCRDQTGRHETSPARDRVSDPLTWPVPQATKSRASRGGVASEAGG